MQPTVFTEYQIIRQQYVRENIDIVQRVEGFTPCWEWRAVNALGYGISAGPRHEKAYGKAYRASYIAFVGPVPEGLHLDHLCSNHPCVNPEHLEPVTQRENVLRAVAYHQARGTGNWNKLDICAKGLHPMTDDNLYYNKIRGVPKRTCRACNLERQRRNRAAKPEQYARYEANRRAKAAA